MVRREVCHRENSGGCAVNSHCVMWTSTGGISNALGVLGQWEDPHLTMSPQYETTIADAFVTFLEKGYVYRGLKPVYWCIVDKTALAEAEVEYEDHTSPSIWVRFSCRARCGGGKAWRGSKLLLFGPPPHGRCHTTARFKPFIR